jgi:hypothetical protein
MSVFFTSGPTPANRQLAEIWSLLEHEYFEDAARLAETVCQDSNAPIEFYCSLSLAYGELGYYEDAENVARTAIGFGEGHWRARHALAVALMHQGRFLGALDSLGFYHTPEEIYVVRAQVEKMGQYTDSLLITLQDALQKNVPPAIQFYLAFLYGSLAEDVPDWGGLRDGFNKMARLRNQIEVWERDAARHQTTPYGAQLNSHLAAIRQVLG